MPRPASKRRPVLDGPPPSPAAGAQRSRGPTITDGLIVISAAVIGFGTLRIIGTPGLGALVLVGGLLVGGCMIAAARVGAARGKPAVRILSTTAATLQPRVAPSALSLRKVRWKREVWHPFSRPQLVSGEIKYVPGAVVADGSAAIASALRPYAAGPLSVEWLPLRARYRIKQRVLTMIDKYPSVSKVIDTLRFIMGGDGGSVGLVEAQSRVQDSGAVECVTATYAQTTRDLNEDFQNRVLQVLEAKTPSPTGAWSLRWNPESHTIEVRPADPLPTFVEYPLDQELGPDDLLRLPLGVNEGGRIQWFDLNEGPHMLLAGGTGAGKTYSINAIIVGAIARGWVVRPVDPKELSFIGLAGWPGIDKIATTDPEMEDAIDEFYQEMRRRYAALKSGLVTVSALTPWLMIADETAELIERLTAYHSSDEKRQALIEKLLEEGIEDQSQLDAIVKAKIKGTKNPEIQKVWSVLRLGRQARMFAIIATQRPDVSFIPGEARSNGRTRLSLGHMDGDGLVMVHGTRSVRQRTTQKVTDEATGEVEHKPIPGRGTLSVVGAVPRPLQGFYIPDPSKARAGELSDHDLERLTQLVTWMGEQRNRALAEGRPASVDDIVAEEIAENAAVKAVLDEDLAKDSQDLPLGGVDTSTWRNVTVTAVEPGSTVAIEFDGNLREVEVTDSDEDEIDPESWLLTYRDKSGDPGVAAFSRDAVIAVADHAVAA